MSKPDNKVPPTADWRQRAGQLLREGFIAGDDRLDAARQRLRARLGLGAPLHIAAYRGYGDETAVHVMGRVLADKPEGGPMEDAGWWDNLLDTWRRFESDEVPGAALRVRLGASEVETASDHEGYYEATLSGVGAPDGLWDNATVTLTDGALVTPQPVLRVLPQARIGIISDIDDTILHSGITNWKVAAQLTFLHNARTRKPLAGVAALYHALQRGVGGSGPNPLFYVSSSPWNLYDLLEDFMELNGIPPGPIFLRDLGTDTGKFLKTPGHGHKLERARNLIHRFPHLRWVLLGDSGQADAELYAEAALEFGDRIAAIYIRDVDPDSDSPFDTVVDGHLQRIAGTRVPMLRVAESAAIARHAADLGLLAGEDIAAVEREVLRDKQRPGQGEAALAGAVGAGPAPTATGGPPEAG
ncbi:App1 family protein [Lysobacter olei]